MDTTLLVMAAGIGSRFGVGIKQLEKVDDYGHIIVDYSIHDALEAGFNKVVFVIRKDIDKEFREVIGDRISKVVDVAYAYQDVNDIPGELPAGRTKPWGTGQAILAAKDLIHEPFIVINADDYYGKEGYVKIHDYLAKGGKCCMAGFVLKNTLSDNGTVTRGICKSENGWLTDVDETKGIEKVNGKAIAKGGVEVDMNSLCSMNMWGLTPDFMDTLEEGFKEFFKTEVEKDPLGCEFLIPTYIGDLLKEKKLKVKVLQSNDTWYGMTYKADVPGVKASFKKLLDAGVYTKDL